MSRRARVSSPMPCNVSRPVAPDCISLSLPLSQVIDHVRALQLYSRVQREQEQHEAAITSLTCARARPNPLSE